MQLRVPAAHWLTHAARVLDDKVAEVGEVVEGVDGDEERVAEAHGRSVREEHAEADGRGMRNEDRERHAGRVGGT